MDRLYKFWTIGIILLILISSIRCETEPKLNSPVVRTNEVTSVSATAISTGGSVTDDGGAPVFARGVCWSINSNPTTSESRTNDGVGTGDYITTISNLQPDTRYYIRSYATNKIGTAYGNQIEITTLGALPVISLIEPSDISSSSFKCGGRITGEGASAVTERGVCWSENSNPSIANSKISSGAGVGEFYVIIDKLIPGKKYFIKAYAVNNHGIAYSSELTINTSPEIPQVKTLDITNVKSTSASGGGEIIKDGGAEISVRGICWSTNQNPNITNSKTTDGAGTGTFISLINGLLPQTTYYVRAYATNSKGIGYGDYKIFTTADAEILFNSKLNYEKIQDIDGNEYKTIKIGTQTWMAENLKVTKLNDGTTLTNEISNQGWSSTSSPAYSLYNNAERSKITYGALYNWASASSGKLCPQGWHIPTDKEWKVLIEYLGGNNSAEAKLKEAGNGHWIASGINESGFTALPGGVRYWDGQFDGLYKFGVFLGSQSSLSSPYYVLLGTRNNLTYYILSHARNGFSVRCIASSVPIVRTTSIIMVANNPVITGNVDDDGGSEVIERGVCWSLNQNPTIEDSKFSNGKGEGMFSCTVYGLLPGKKYYARAYAKNYAGIAYGNQISFETDPVPSLLTNSVYGVTTNSAICSASITDRGGTAILVRGVCWSKEENPTKDDYVIASTDISDNYTCEIYQLSPGTTYYIRAFATNFTGTGYGNLITFKTKSDIPKITTSETTHITSNSAISGGTITSDGGEPVLSRGVCWSQKNNPTVNGNKTNDGAGVGHFISSLSDLNSGEKYYIRAYATNKIGTAYGHEVSFITQKAIPKLTTKEISSVSSNTAISGGNIISTGGAFIMEKGICWNTSDNPTTSHYNTPYFGIDTSFTCTMGGLQPGTVYYVRSYAKNSVGTGYGNSVTFKTKNIVPQPTIQPAGGKYFEAQKVSISCSVKEAEIRYTTDGTNPNESSRLYKSEITVDKSMTIKARAYKAGWIESSVITESYVIEIAENKYADGEYKVAFSNTSGSFPNEIVFTGDGYIEDDYYVGGQFDKDIDEGIEAFFSVEPYKSYRKYFKVYKLAAYSKNRGATHIDKFIFRSTVFNSKFLGGTSISANYDEVFQFVSKSITGTSDKLNNILIVLIINDNRYAGTCYSPPSGQSIAMCPTSRVESESHNFKNILIHEAGGHGFGRLADEYVGNDNMGKAITPDQKVHLIERVKLGFEPNVDLTSDLSIIKWKHFVNRSGYSVGAYEGGFYFSYGVWKPEETSCMIDNRRYFNAPSREHIVKRILRTAHGVRVSEYVNSVYRPIPNDPYSLEEFIRLDVKKTETATLFYTKSLNPLTFVPLAPPVVVK